MVAVTLAGAFLTTWAVPSQVVLSNPSHAVVRNHDIFVRVFTARFALVFGQTLLMTYVLYFFAMFCMNLIPRPARPLWQD